MTADPVPPVTWRARTLGDFVVPVRYPAYRLRPDGWHPVPFDRVPFPADTSARVLLHSVALTLVREVVESGHENDEAGWGRVRLTVALDACPHTRAQLAACFRSLAASLAAGAVVTADYGGPAADLARVALFTPDPESP